MNRPAKLIFILIMTTTQVFASEEVNESTNCIKTAKVVLFTKASASIDYKFKELVRRKKMTGLYSDFEAQTILKNKKENYPVALCDQSLILSVDEYSKTLQKNCNHEDIEFTVKDFALELLNEISEKEVKSLFKSTEINNRKMNLLIDSMQAKTCSNSKHRVEINSIDLTIGPKKLCHKIIKILNSIKNNC